MVIIRIIEGDISSINADALVNAANNHLWMGSGVAGALKRKGGDIVEQEAVSKGPIEIGSAVATGAGNLASRFVIHGAVMGQDLLTDSNKIERTTISCLELAIELKLSSIAFPAFGCGVGGMSYRKTAEAMKRAFDSFDNGSLDDLQIIIVLFGMEAHSVFNSVF